MNENANARQLIVDKIKQATNILVAVSANPSVDALTAALGLSLLLNKLDKHATAVFSGKLPQAMQFLEPGKTFENNVDSLRDFIISLDREKADRLRYKVEDDVVRIFITPYRTTITKDDLQFSQGDFNVELIIALGVEKREDLDAAIVAHGRILHDATVVTVNINNQQSSLGAIDWHDAQASSLSEMMVGLNEGMQKPGLLDAQIATALLTGIVASTERFSNNRTTPRVMTMAAQLMAAGANQQLVANNLQASQLPVASKAPEQAEQEPAASPNGQLSIKHDKSKSGKSRQAQKEAEDELEAALPTAAAPVVPSLEELKAAIEDAEPKSPPKKNRGFIGPADAEAGSHEVDTSGPIAEPEPSEELISEPSWRGRKLEPPTLGGTLSSTAQEALDEETKEEADKRNHTLLDHPQITEPPSEPEESAQQTVVAPPVNESQPYIEPSTFQPEALSAELDQMAEPEPLRPQDIPPVPTSVAETMTQPEGATDQPKPAQAEPEQEPAQPETPPADIDMAREAVNTALAAQAFSPARSPSLGIGAQAVPPEQALDISQQPATQTQLSNMAPPPAIGALPDLPPMPSLGQLDPHALPPMPPGLEEPPSGMMNNLDTPPLNPPTPATTNDPGQFKIPGQS